MPLWELEQNLTFWENSSISQVFQYRKKTLLLSCLVKIQKNDVHFFPDKMG